jgi:hypothetical protein
MWMPAASILYVHLYPPTLLINDLYNVHHFQASVIFGPITIFGPISWYLTTEEKWLSKEQVLQALHSTNHPKMPTDYI